MEVNNKRGCALCDATWGEYWDDAAGTRMRFCCNICASAFANMIGTLKKTNKWTSIDRLEITGNNNTGRKCLASSHGKDFHFFIKFYNDGRILDFHKL